ncbi:CRTAC1 family protein [Actinoplanes sp. NPDC049802]|uniref:CRTAC1 family protein n=1 Tax=Actinoplanes sp. NPDC049802 TaxID=3154742 RepID=UPI0033C3AB94
MPTQPAGLLRRLLPSLFVVLLVGALYLIAQTPTASASARHEIASRYRFTGLPIALPPGLPHNTVRRVNTDYEHIRSWVSSVGAAIAINDLTGAGTAQDLCLVDTRSDAVVVTPAPGTGDRFAPFVLDPAPLPTGPGVAPMGCNPGDFNQDGRMDLLTYYWGRTPVLFLNKQSATGPLSKASYRATELVPQAPSPDGTYHGPLWNTNAVAVADFDSDGHPDIGVFNYFPDSGVLDPDSPANVSMNHSMSRAENGGGAHILRWIAATGGDEPSASYREQPGAIDPAKASGWTLGSASADLDGDMLPELYLANDFGHDHLFHNVSTPGRIKFASTSGRRGAATPKSMVLGHDSFKGMSVEFGDLTGTGRFDMFVSNITTSWGIEESNFLWKNTATSAEDAKAKLSSGVAPFDQKAADYGMAFTGWGWDAKMADFDNSGHPAVVQADGFVKGTINRWSWLQELAMSNDLMLQNPDMWPHARPGDDISGHEALAFWARGEDGAFTNISKELGMAVPVPTRGIAVGDTDGNGGQDFAVARQWDEPIYYRNDNPGDGDFVGLRLHRPALGDTTGAATTPAYGAKVRLTTADGRTQLAQVDGGGGHSGRRSFDVFFGLGANGDRPATAEISWVDLDGGRHVQTLELNPGWHDLMLTEQATEVAAR